MSFSAIARFYDDDDGQLVDDIPALLEFAADAGGPVLELGAGTGRLLLPLARAGYDVTGVELSGEMLALARERVRRAGFAQRVHLHQTDFRSFDLAKRFALAYCGYNSFLHLIDVPDQLAALRCWRRHLAADGMLVIDVSNPDLAQLAAADGSLAYADEWVDPASGHAVQKFVAAEADLAAQTLTMLRVYDEIGNDGILRRTSTRLVARILFRREFETLLPLAGFADLRFFGDYDLSPWTSDSPRILVCARAGNDG